MIHDSIAEIDAHVLLNLNKARKPVSLVGDRNFVHAFDTKINKLIMIYSTSSSDAILS